MPTLRIATAILSIAILAVPIGLFAFQAQGDFNAADRLKELQSRLNLTPDQAAKIKPILEDEASKVKDIRAKYANDTAKGSKLGMAQELRAVQEDAQKRINPILTADQQAEWQEIRAERLEDLKNKAGK